MKVKIIILSFFIVAFCNAQEKYDVDGNNLPNNAKLGSLNNKNLNIITSSRGFELSFEPQIIRAP